MKQIKHPVAMLILLLLLSPVARAASTLLYFPSDYTAASGSPARVTNQPEFAPICEDASDIYSARLPGLDMVRGFSSAPMCQISTATTNTFANETEYTFLVDDTAPLSPYLLEQMRQKNALQTQGGREIIKPTVINFESDGNREGFSILVVGEVAFAQNTDEAGWFAALEGRFAQDQVIAGGQDQAGDDDEIWFAYHGGYYNKLGQFLSDVSVEKIVEFMQKQITQLPSGGASPAPTPATPPPASPPPLPSRPLNDYMRACNNNFVPLPPVWNPQLGPSLWQRQGVVPNPFAAPGLTQVEVWTYESTSPQGICFALPRMSAGGNIGTDIGALGIICQSQTTGKACFWDNVERPTGAADSGETDEFVRRPAGQSKIRGAATVDLDPVNMSDGYNLNENCTDCHRGSNVFLIQAGTGLAASSRTPAVRYQPLSGSPPSVYPASSRFARFSWENPVSTVHPLVESASSDDQCTLCHDSDNEFPQVTRAYCSTVLKNSIGANMPPGSGSADWADDHLEEVRVLSQKCCDLGISLALSDNSGAPLNAVCTSP